MMPVLFIAMKTECHKKKVGTLGWLQSEGLSLLPIPSSTFFSLFWDFCMEIHNGCVIIYNVPQGMHLQEPSVLDRHSWEHQINRICHPKRAFPHQRRCYKV